MKRRSILKLAAGIWFSIGCQPMALAVTNASQEKTLNLAEALRIADKFPPASTYVLELSNYKYATPDALTYLASQFKEHKHYISLGLTKIDKITALILENWEAEFIDFANLESLDVEVAEILSNAYSTLHFDRMQTISNEVAKELANTNGMLILTMDSISGAVAKELAKHRSELMLDSNIPPSRQVMGMLCDHQGYYLRLGGWNIKPEYFNNFESPNFEKTIRFGQHQAESGEWQYWVYVREDIDRWVEKKNVMRSA